MDTIKIKLNKIIKVFSSYLGIILDDNNDDKSLKVLEELEEIDDECDTLGITFVKIDNMDEAKEYGIESMPALLYFEKGIPTVYEGRLEDEESLLKWLEQQTKSDEIEDITNEMFDLILEKMPYVAVIFCKLKLFVVSYPIFTHYTMSVFSLYFFFCSLFKMFMCVFLCSSVP